MIVGKILLVGYGSIGKRHLKNLQNLLPQAQFTVLRSRRGVDSIEGCEVVHGFSDALAFQPQIAFICNPANYHLPIANKLAAAGVSLFIEKPLSNSTAGMAELIEEVQRRGVAAMVGYNLRFSSSLQQFKKFIESGDFGRILSVSAEVGQYLPDWRPDTDYRSSVSANSTLGGGALLELSHELDYLSWLFGNPVSVSGKLLKVSELETDVEDLVLAHICFSRDDVPIHSSVQMDFLQRKAHRTCKVICERATLIWDAIEDCVEIHRKNESFIAFQGDKNRNHTYEQEVMQFIHCVENNTPVSVPLEEGLKTLKLIEALKSSSELGRVVNL